MSVSATDKSSHGIIRQASVSDLDALVDLETTCFAAPWSRKSFEAELQGNQFSHVFVIPANHESQNNSLLAYICVWVVFEEIRFLNLAVHPHFRRQGMAKRLIQQALSLGIDHGCSRGLLEVRRSNHSAKVLYESFRFREYAIRTSYYTNPKEDAILMMVEPLSLSVSEQNT